MENNKFVAFGIALVIVLIGALVVLSLQSPRGEEGGVPGESTTTGVSMGSPTSTTPFSTGGTSGKPAATKGTLSLANAGRVVVAITDKAADLESIRSLFITVLKVQVFETKQGWVTVPSGEKTFDLLELRNSNDFGYLGELFLTPSTYTKFSLTVSNVSALFNDGTSRAVTLPSNNLTFIGQFRVEKGETYSITFDILADKSLHQTNDGAFILLPVVKMSTGVYVKANVLPNNKVRLSGSVGGTGATVGMNENGDSVPDFSLTPTTILSFTDGVLTLRAYSVDASNALVSASRALEIATGGSYIDHATSLWLIQSDRTLYWRITAIKGNNRITIDIDAATGKVIER